MFGRLLSYQTSGSPWETPNLSCGFLSLGWDKDSDVWKPMETANAATCVLWSPLKQGYLSSLVSVIKFASQFDVENFQVSHGNPRLP